MFCLLLLLKQVGQVVSAAWLLWRQTTVSRELMQHDNSIAGQPLALSSGRLPCCAG
jgi:hypothetical protein